MTAQFTKRRFLLLPLILMVLMFTSEPARCADLQQEVSALLDQIGTERGICVLLNVAEDAVPMALARRTKLTLYVQLPDEDRVTALRKAADAAGLLGSQVYAVQADAGEIHLGSNLADVVVAAGGAGQGASRQEILRVLRPGGKALLGKQTLVKKMPEGAGRWDHPYHGPDNNPQSTDTIAQAPYLTHFLATPFYGPMPEVTVVSAGRMFKAFGHISFKEREQPLINRLMAINAYNGTVLWERELREGFMIHRNTMIATPDALLLADDESCKILDAVTGKLRDQIIVEDEITKDKVWKWMALRDGVLYAMLGPKEQPAIPLKGTRTAPGWPWTGLGKGYGQADYPWGFGNTLLAIELATKKVLWDYHEAEALDSRAACMNGKQLFFYGHGYFLGSLDLKTGKLLWRTTNSDLLAAIGEHDRAQHWQKGFSTSAYTKCNEDALFFAGPQRNRLVAVSAKDGKMLWNHPHGNYQLIVRPDALYALGRLDSSKKFDLHTGKVIADLECFRGNCTRATATVDGIFTRGHEHTGTQRISFQGDRSTRIPLMRPACQDGVVVAGGLLYWGPWMCDCNLSLTGIISLAPAGDFPFGKQASDEERLQAAVDADQVADFKTSKEDWPTYRASNARQSGTIVSVARDVRQVWEHKPSSARTTTAPIAVGGLVFVSGSDGSVQALDAGTGRSHWTAYTGGRVFYPPSVWNGRVYVGSGDGWVYALEATTGRRLWRFRAAPIERTIPVYDHLTSTWPVASGALVDDGVVYAAAGIASYDGTHVYALDAISGKIHWQNNTSGRLVEDDLVTGVSVQGHLLLHKDRLYLAGGNVVSPAIYSTADGTCQNKLNDEWGKGPRGRELFLVGDQVTAFDRLLYSPKPYQMGRYHNQSFAQATSGDVLMRARAGQIFRIDPSTIGGAKPTALWQHDGFRWVESLAVADGAVVAAGQLQASGNGDAGGDYALVAIDSANGKTIWTQTLPAAPASWGLAIDRDGRVLLTLNDGRLLCFSSK